MASLRWIVVGCAVSLFLMQWLFYSREECVQSEPSLRTPRLAREEVTDGPMGDVGAVPPSVAVPASTNFFDSLPDFQRGLDRHSYALSHEDTWLLDTLFMENGKPKLNGFFVEIGANDGTLFSNTLLFEAHLGWKGILIEGSPSQCQKVKDSPRFRVLKYCTAVCNETHAIYDDVPADSSLNGIKKLFKGASKRQGRTNPVQVPCRTLSSIIVESGIPRIDLFILDVEGAEDVVLSTFRFEVKVHYWFIELEDCRVEEVPKNERVRAMLRERGFVKCPRQHPSPCGNDCWMDPNY